MNTYNLQSSAYNDARNQSASAASGAASAAAFQDSSATGSLSDIQGRNSSASKVYAVAGAVLAGWGAYKFAQSAACAASCGTGGCCPMAPALMAAGAAFMLLNSMANKQSGEHVKSAYDACLMQNQISTSQQSCSTLYPNQVTTLTPTVSNDPTVNQNTDPNNNTTTFNPDGTPRTPGTVTVGDIDPQTGQCKPDAPPACKQLLGNNTIGKIAASAGPNKLADATGMYKQLPDGSVQTKDGKIYKISDFANEEAMIKAGLSPSDAKALAKQLYGEGGVLAASGLDAEGLLKDANKKSAEFGVPGIGDGGAGSSGSGKGNLGSGKNFKDALNATKRKPSSAGLTRNFNGDIIGASGDDIFLMMNRRYRLKNEQDSFIAP